MKKLISLFFIISLAAPSLHAMTAREIIKKSDALPEPASAYTHIIMTISRGGRSIDKEFKLRTKKIRGETRTLVTFIRPSRMKVLTHSHRNSDDDQWIRLSSGRVKRIAGAEKSKAFAGSHLTYHDLQSREINDYRYKKLSDTSTRGDACYRVEAIKSRGTKIYSKIILHVRKSDFFVVQVDIYKKGRLYKHIENTMIKKISGILTPLRVTVRLARKKETTVLKVKAVRYNRRMRNSIFNKSFLH